jgi:two-component system cell cycle response regulator
MGGEPILVVDDHPQNLKLVVLLLTIAGYRVQTAHDAEGALRQLQTNVPRLILLDIQLPGMDGLELTRTLRADPHYRDLVIVALTAYAMKGDRERALAAGCDGYIPKPIDTQRFPQLIEDFLSRTASP